MFEPQPTYPVIKRSPKQLSESQTALDATKYFSLKLGNLIALESRPKERKNTICMQIFPFQIYKSVATRNLDILLTIWQITVYFIWHIEDFMAGFT